MTPPFATVAASEARYWNAVAADWRTAPAALWRLHSDVVNLALLARWLPRGGNARVLKTDLFDEALAEGLYPVLAAGPRRFVGIDLSVTILRGARRRHADLRAAGADVRRLPFADGVFDVVVSNSTLDHFASATDIPASLRELRRTLRPGGELVLTLDNPRNPIIRLRNALPFQLLRRTRLVPYYVGATCGPRRTRRLLEDAGFEVLEESAIMHCPRVLVVAASGLVERASPAVRRQLLRGLAACERLGRWPTRYLTGHFLAVRARRRA